MKTGRNYENMAKKIRARAIQRGGELLADQKAQKGGRPSKTKGGGSPSLRKAMAKDAGITAAQAKPLAVFQRYFD